jgi:UDP-N-acetylmuramoyl-L-alanyl-D-glutamate--2,6-diaminopimelate ligase
MLPDSVSVGAPDINVAGLTADSRLVAPGFLFAALAGTQDDGARFIADAVARGAAAVLARTGTIWPEGVPARPLVLHAEPRRALALAAAAFHGAQPKTIAAVTGTNGKTSTVDFLRQIFAHAQHRAASIGTLGVIGPEGRLGESLTTPDPVALHATLAELARQGITHAGLEASSHGLAQFRLDGVRLAAAGFTNLTRDHLDYHGSMEAYRAAKLRLLHEVLPAGAPAVVATTLDAETRAAINRPVLLAGEGGDFARLVSWRALPEGQALRVVLDGLARDVLLPLAGKFQAENALLAAALAVVLGEPAARVLDALATLSPVRGRMEFSARLANGAAAYVDYAHTPDALTRLIAALRPHARGRIILVFGAGGDRDPGKRALMGQAARAADIAIVTDDNPRSEDPARIRAAVLAGHGSAIDGGDRRAAIGRALAMAQEGDVVAVAGKGHETGQEIAGHVHPFDDASVIREIVG